MKLAPSLVEKDPHYNAWMIAALLNHLLQFMLKLIRSLRLALDFSFIGPRRIAGVRHILPHQKPQFVAPIIPALRLDFDMLAAHIKSELFCHFNVIAQRRIRWRSVNAVWPISLVQWPELKHL